MSRLLIVGPQGSGKGTQGAVIADEYGVPVVSTGDIFRENIKNGTELGQKVKSITAAGDRGEGTVFARVSRSTGRVVQAMERSLEQGRELAAPGLGIGDGRASRSGGGHLSPSGRSSGCR